MKKLKNFFVVLLLIMTVCPGCTNIKEFQATRSLNAKRLNAEKAIKLKNEEQAQKKAAIENDKEPPELKCSENILTIEVNEDIDYDLLKSFLTATDNVDGDITDKIEQMSSNIKEHKIGNYEINYSVSDSAGNVSDLTVPVNIISKYTQDEIVRYEAALHCYDKIYESLKNPDSLNIEDIIAAEDGSTIKIIFSATNGFGARVTNKALYDKNIGFVIDDKGPFYESTVGVRITKDELINYYKYSYPNYNN